MNLLPYLQARARQLLGVRGGPLMSGSDFIQLVAPVGTADGPHRNPAVEIGEGLKRQFIGVTAVAGPVVGEYSIAQCFTEDSNTLVHVRRIILNWSADGTAIKVGLDVSPAALTDYLASYTDMRLFSRNLPNFEGGTLRIRAGTSATAPFTGTPGAYQYMQSNRGFANADYTCVLDVDYVLTRFDVSGQGGVVLTVATENTNVGMRNIVFEGELYTFGPGAR